MECTEESTIKHSSEFGNGYDNKIFMITVTCLASIIAEYNRYAYACHKSKGL